MNTFNSTYHPSITTQNWVVLAVTTTSITSTTTTTTTTTTP
jgi:hypothetical protein